MLMVIVMVWMLHHPSDGVDVTNTSYNKYVPCGVYRLLKEMHLEHFRSAAKQSFVYYIQDYAGSGPFYDGKLPVGTRIRFDKAVWASSHEGPGAAVAYGTILDPPFANQSVLMNDVSDRFDLIGFVQPNHRILTLETDAAKLSGKR